MWIVRMCVQQFKKGGVSLPCIDFWKVCTSVSNGLSLIRDVASSIPSPYVIGCPASCFKSANYKIAYSTFSIGALTPRLTAKIRDFCWRRERIVRCLMWTFSSWRLLSSSNLSSRIVAHKRTGSLPPWATFPFEYLVVTKYIYISFSSLWDVV
jgi:hypothetical protein